MRCSQAQISTTQISEYSSVSSLDGQGPQPDLKSKIKSLVLDLVGVFLKSGSNEVSFRLLWSRCTGGPPTTGRRKSLRSLLRPWLAVSQIKTTNYDNVIGSLCGQRGLPVCSWGWHWPFFSPWKCQALFNHPGHKHDKVNVQALLVKQFC